MKAIYVPRVTGRTAAAKAAAMACILKAVHDGEAEYRVAVGAKLQNDLIAYVTDRLSKMSVAYRMVHHEQHRAIRIINTLVLFVAYPDAEVERA